MKKRIINISVVSISILLIAVGAFIIAYPNLVKQNDKIKTDQIIENYNKEITTTEPQKHKKADNKEVSIKNINSKNENNHKPKKLNLKQLKKDIKAYNKKIYDNNQQYFNNKTMAVEPLNLMKYGFSNKVYGYLTIPKINLQMPIYLGCSDYNMSIGAAQLGQTSIPYVGVNTNSVIAGHCGYGYKDYFRYIEKLRPGDKVQIKTPFNKLNYTVTKRKILKPKMGNQLLIREDKDMITLFTCYPYPTNKYRCCIFCERS